MRVALYIRKSTADQNTELQHRELNEFVKARNWSVVTVYEDSATGKTDQRPELKKMLLAARERKFDALVVWKLDRLFRSLKNLVNTLQEFTDLGIQFVSLKDSIDLTTANGRLLTHLLGAFAEFEASLIQERVRAGIANAKAKGVHIGRPQLKVKDEILRLRKAGLTYCQIQEQLGVSAGTVRNAVITQKPCPKQAEEN